MKKLLAFIAIGSGFATVEEFLTVVVLRHDIPSYVFTLVVLFPVFLGFVYLSSRAVDRCCRDESTRFLAHFLTYGSIGLVMEWTLMGLAPWSNPRANPWLMFLFQLGMFSFWATVASAPRLFLDPRESCRKTKRAILVFYVPYFVIVYAAGLSVPAGARFVTIISLVIVGYLAVAALLVKHAVDSMSRVPAS